MNRMIKEGGLLFLRATGHLERCLSRSAAAARILTYHGLCRDEHAGQEWVPDSFVTVRRFEWQMEYLAEKMVPIRLDELAAMLKRGDPPTPRTVVVTFDDGLANTVRLAAPILAKYGLKATFFLTTALIGTEQLLWFDRLRWIRRLAAPAVVRGDDLLSGRIDPKKADVRDVLARLDPWWAEIRGRIPTHVLDALRLMTWEEARALQRAGHSIGAHTRNHAILSAQPDPVRQEEIIGSVREVRERCGTSWLPFAYPNGQPGDFDHRDAEWLRACEVGCAVTTVAGPNQADQDLLRLRRNSIGRYHTHAGFLAELAGLRDRG